MRVGRLYLIWGVFAVLAGQFCLGSAADAHDHEVPLRVFLLVPAASGYAVVDFGALPQGTSQVIRALNNGGEVVGGASTSGASHRAFVLSSTRLERLPGADYSAAHGINDLGEVVGSSNGPTSVEAFRWTRKGGHQRLAPLPGDNSREAFGINSHGQVVGYSSGPGGARGVPWTRNGAVQGLGTLPGSTYSRALAINEPGNVVGTSGMSPATRAFLWTPSAGMKDLGMLPGDRESEAVHINDAGDVVGWSSGPDGGPP